MMLSLRTVAGSNPSTGDFRSRGSKYTRAPVVRCEVRVSEASPQVSRRAAIILAGISAFLPFRAGAITEDKQRNLSVEQVKVQSSPSHSYLPFSLGCHSMVWNRNGTPEVSSHEFYRFYYH